MKNTYIFAINGMNAFLMKEPPRVESDNRLIITLADAISDPGAQATVNWIRECYGPTPTGCKISIIQSQFGISTSVQEFSNCFCVHANFGDLSFDSLCDQTIILEVLVRSQ